MDQYQTDKLAIVLQVSLEICIKVNISNFNLVVQQTHKIAPWCLTW